MNANRHKIMAAVILAVSISAAMGLLAAKVCSAESPFPPKYSWSELRVGMKVFTTDQPVCSSLETLAGAFSSRTAKCLPIKYGSAAKVERVMISERLRRSGVPQLVEPIIFVRAADNSWFGYTSILGLQPNIPTGTLLHVVPQAEAPSLLGACPARSCGGVPIVNRMEARLLEYHPEQSETQLYVKVVDGPYRNRHGWISLADLDVSTYVDVGYFGIDYSRWRYANSH